MRKREVLAQNMKIGDQFILNCTNAIITDIYIAVNGSVNVNTDHGHINFPSHYHVTVWR